MASIADVFLRALLEDKQLQIDAKKSGDKAGQTLGERMSKALTAKNVGTAIGAVMGGAAGGALKLGSAYAAMIETIRTGTGATGDELADLEQSFRNVGSRMEHDLGFISEVMTDLHQRTGLTGKALEDLTVRVIDFSDVTGTDATTNTANLTRLFGDWSIATEDQAETMDKLLRASQVTGLEVDRLMDTVVQFGAPLRLLGFGLEESAALLGKWEKEGVNVETMLTGLKFSVKTLANEGVPAAEMAETLRARIAAIGESTDPVSEAIELFGLRAGPDLAAAILEGRFSIEDLMEVIENGSETVDQAAADTEKLGDTFGILKNKVKLAIGPILQDFAGLAEELGNAIYLLPALGGALGRGLGSLWSKAARSQLATTAVARAGSMAATLYLRALMVGDAITGALRAGWAKVIGNTVIAGIIAKAGTAAATGYLKFLIAGDAISGALTGAWKKTGGAALTAAGTAGSKAGLAFKIAFIAAAIFLWKEVLDTFNDQKSGIDAMASDIGKSVGEQLVAGSTESLEQSKSALQDGIRKMLGSPMAFLAQDAIKDMAAQITLIEAELARRGDDLAGKIADDFAGSAPEIEAGAETMMGGLPSAIRDIKGTASTIAATIPGALSSALRDDRTAWQRAWDQLKEDASNSMSTTVEIARIKGKLAKIAASEGWKSGDQVWIQSLKDTQTILQNRLSQLAPAAKKDGEDAGEGLADGLTRKQRRVRAAANSLAEEARNRFNALQNNAYRYGSNTGDAYVNGLLAELRSGKTSVKDAIYAISRLMYANTPPKYRESPLFGIDRWGGATGEAYTSPLVEQIQGAVARVRRSLADMSSALTQPMGMPAIAAAGVGALGGSVPLTGLAGTTISSSTGPITVNVDARGATNPHAVGQAVGDAMASVLRDQTARLPRSGR